MVLIKIFIAQNRRQKSQTVRGTSLLRKLLHKNAHWKEWDGKKLW